MTDDVDRNRRHFLTVATAVAGGVGVAFAAVPFLASLKPSARAQALGAPVEVQIGSLEPGEMVRVLWRGKPVWVLRRTEEMLERLPQVDQYLRDPASQEEQQPKYAANAACAMAGYPRAQMLTLHVADIEALQAGDEIATAIAGVRHTGSALACNAAGESRTDAPAGAGDDHHAREMLHGEVTLSR